MRPSRGSRPDDGGVAFGQSTSATPHERNATAGRVGGSCGAATTVSGVRFLLRPGWVALTAGVVVFAIACFTLLAPWQMSRHEQKKAQNDAISASFDAAPTPLADADPATGEWRQVVVTGVYAPEAEVVARLRTVQGEPAFEVLTPLRLPDGATVLIDRGFVRPAGGERGVPDYTPAPAGTVTVVGRLRRDESTDRAPVTDSGRLQVYAIDSRSVGAATGLDLRPGYVQLNADQPGVLGPLPLPQLTAGPYFAYSLQWAGFGLMALVGWALVVRREHRDRATVASGAPPRPSKRALRFDLDED